MPCQHYAEFVNTTVMPLPSSPEPICYYALKMLIKVVFLQVGLTSPGFIGADVYHLNLHKTFAFHRVEVVLAWVLLVSRSTWHQFYNLTQW
jgi:hypothetical protein